MMINGLQTKGIFCCACNVEPERIVVGLLWLRDRELLGQTVSLIASDSDDGKRYAVRLPEELSSPEKNIELPRVLTV